MELSSLDAPWTLTRGNGLPHNDRTSSTRLRIRREAQLQRGARAPNPRVWLRSPRFFTPYRPTRTRQDLPCTSAGEPAPPDGG